MSRVLALLSLALIPFAVNAQKVWTLEECINHALSHNIQLKRMGLQVESAQRDLRQVQVSHAPGISAFYSHNYYNGTIFNQHSARFETIENQSGNMGVGSDVTLFHGLRIWNARLMLRHTLNSNREASNVFRNQITLAVVGAYLQILYDAENLTISTGRYEVLQQQLDRVQAQHQLGMVTATDVLNINSQALSQKAMVALAEGQLLKSQTELAMLLELDSNDDFSIDLSPIESGEEYLPLAFAELHQEIAASRPEIRRAEHDKLAAERNLMMAYGSLSPRITLGYQLGSGYDRTASYATPDGVQVVYPSYTYRNQLEDYIQHNVYFNVSIPIFQRLSNYTQITKAKIQVTDAQYAYQEAQKEVYKDVQRAYTDASISWSNYLALEETARSQQELYTETLSRFELGVVSAVDLSVAQANLVEAQGRLLHAKYTFILQSKILDFYRGVPIAL